MENKPIKIDLTSSVVEKGIELAKDFLEKLVFPAVEETGLLIKEQITSFRFKNQVKILNSSKQYCDLKGISPKAISLKLLVPLLENASLEEDDYLQNKWAILLANMVDSEQNIENHVFPFLLGQISKTEFLILEKVNYLRDSRTTKLKAELEEFQQSKPTIKKDLEKQLSEIPREGHESWVKRWKLEAHIRELDRKEHEFFVQIYQPEYVSEDDLEEFEISNLIRLGIIKSIPQHYAYSRGKEIKNNPDASHIVIEDLEIEIENSGDKYTITELGYLFIRACKEKE